jgi:hypothetical protein
MTLTSELVVIGIAALAVCASVMQAARVVARSRIKRQTRMQRISSVVTGSSPAAPNDQYS